MKIKEAVDLLKDYKGDQPDVIGPYEIRDARRVLADAYLALHREDDGEVLPFCESECGQYSVFIGLDGAYVLRIGKGDALLLHAEYKTRPTMGQLRHLVRGLGGEA